MSKPHRLVTAILPDCGPAKGIVGENKIVVRRARPEHSSRLVSAWTRTDLGLAGEAAEKSIILFQVFLGILGLLLYRLVKRAYPQIDQLGGSPPFQERKFVRRILFLLNHCTRRRF